MDGFQSRFRSKMTAEGLSSVYGNGTLPGDVWSNNFATGEDHTELYVSLSALKHDHPLVVTAYDNLNQPVYDGNDLSPNMMSDGLLIGSLPPNTANADLSTAQWPNGDVFGNGGQFRKIDCRPYGYLYADDADEGDMSGIYAQMPYSLPNSVEDDLILSDKSYIDSDMFDYQQNVNFNPDHFACGEDSAYSCIKVEDAFQVDRADIKSSPTLAQLNFASDVSSLTDDLWDSLDLDQLLSSSYSDANKSSHSSSSFNNHNAIKMESVEIKTQIVPAQTLPVTEDDPKLQENIDYLTNLLMGSKNGGHQCSTQPNHVSQIKDMEFMESEEQKVKSQTVLKQVEEPPPPIKLERKENCAESSLSPVSSNTVLNNLLNSQSVAQATVETLVPTNKPLVNVVLTECKSSSRKRNSSMSTDCSFSSHDEGFASQPEDSDNDDEDEEDGGSSDDESFFGDYEPKDLLGATTSDDANNKWALNMGRSRKGGQQRYFWQYNVQSKGPKGTRLASLEENVADPHVLCEANDPVFSPNCHVEGVKHAGKARRGDGNDLTPNARKLLMIGLELKKLSKVINDLTPVAEVPPTARNKTRKEKNKLASRACRLKKKAQHEANKIKLFGLQQEHKKLMTVIIEMKKIVRRSIDSRLPVIGAPKLSIEIEHLLAQKGPSRRVAGHTTDFVNSVLDNVAAGVSSGGLENV